MACAWLLRMRNIAAEDCVDQLEPKAPLARSKLSRIAVDGNAASPKTWIVRALTNFCPLEALTMSWCGPDEILTGTLTSIEVLLQEVTGTNTLSNHTTPVPCVAPKPVPVIVNEPSAPSTLT